MVLWAFGYTLVACLTAAQGRGGLMLQFAIQGAFWCVAVGLAMGVHAAWRALRRRPGLVKWPLVAGACVAAGLVVTAVDLATYDQLARHWFPAWRSWAEVDIPRFASVLILYVWTFALNASLFWALSASEHAQAQSKRAAEAEAEAQRAQLAALRLQLNPHFMFNTLNAISGLVLEGDLGGADAMISRLASFLRAAMDIDPNAMTPLGEEISNLEAYLDIEAARFGERLVVDYACPPELRPAAVPSLILQPLVENAIKHAVAPARRPVSVQLSARLVRGELQVSVTDDGPGSSGALPGGVGLSNVRARLATLYGDEGRLITRRRRPGFTATVAVPFRAMEAVAA